MPSEEAVKTVSRDAARPTPATRPSLPRTVTSVVLIEDDATLRDSLAEYLTSKGYAVATAARGGRDRVALRGQVLREGVAQGRVVLDQHHRRHRPRQGRASRGRRPGRVAGHGLHSLFGRHDGPPLRQIDRVRCRLRADLSCFG